MGIAAESAAESRERFMRVALEMAERSMAAGGPPVGACLVRDGQVLAAGHNQVVGDIDATAHAEMVVLRAACQAERALTLPDTTLYVTVEPCPMCISAACYADVSAIVFGAPITALAAITGHELAVATETLLHGQAGPTVAGGLLQAECDNLLQRWGVMWSSRA